MMKQWFMAALAACATSVLLLPTLADAAGGIELDPGFGGNMGRGMRFIDPPGGGSGFNDIEDGYRVFVWTEATPPPPPPLPPVTLRIPQGYYIVGTQFHSDGEQRAWIARYRFDGTLDSSFGTSGYLFRDKVAKIDDAWVDGDRAYLLSDVRGSSGLPDMTRVDCVDLVTQSSLSCFPGFGGVLAWGTSTTGPRTGAYGQRLAKEGSYLYVAARTRHDTLGEEVAVAKITADTGSLVAGFGTGGYAYTRPTWALTGSNAGIAVNDLLLGTLDGPRLILAGHAKVNYTPWDTDGYIIGLSANTGVLIPEWSRRIYFESDNPGEYKNDSVTAVARLRGGKLAYAGWSASDDAQYRPMIMGRFNADGSYDTTFCPGMVPPGVNQYACNVEAGVDEFYWPDSQPVALAQRRDNDNLIVALRSMNSGSAGPDHVVTRVMQYSPNGDQLLVDRMIDYPGASLEAHWSRPFGMLLNASLNAARETIAVVGTRRYNSTDFDGTLTHLLLVDGPEIFSDGFED